MAKRVRIEVAVRIRPSNDETKSIAYNSKSITIRGSKSYSFNNVFLPQTTQREVFNNCNMDIALDRLIQGFNTTVIAFGQTGAGKTYTMEGAQDRQTKNYSEDGLGLVPRSIRAIFQKIKNSQQYQVSCSFLQIYNQKIYDLLSSNTFLPSAMNTTVRDSNTNKAALKMRWDRYNEFSVENLQNRICSSEAQMQKFWTEGLKYRVVASTRYNLVSSRSHTIFTIQLCRKNDSSKYSRLEFVDLAGSERVSGDYRATIKQAIDINKSLFALRKVINSLQAKDTFVPYRDSKLTSLLKQSFGGNSYCLFIACINPSQYCLDESISTLDYTTKASLVENRVQPQHNQRDLIVEELKRQNEALRSELNSCYKQIDQLVAVQEKQQAKIQNNQELSKINKVSEQDISLLPENQTQYSRAQNRFKQQIKVDYDYFGQRLVESINTVRELLKSNKQLRQQLDDERAKCQHYIREIEQLVEENQKLYNLRDLPCPNCEQKSRLIQQLPRGKSYSTKRSFKTRQLRISTQKNDDL